MYCYITVILPFNIDKINIVNLRGATSDGRIGAFSLL